MAVVAAEVAELEKQEKGVVLPLHLHTLEEEEEESAECSIKGDEVKPSIPVQAMAAVGQLRRFGSTLQLLKLAEVILLDFGSSWIGGFEVVKAETVYTSVFLFFFQMQT